MTIHTTRKQNTLTLRFEGKKGPGGWVSAGVAGYVVTLPGGVLVTDMFKNPVRIFPSGEEVEAERFIVNSLK
jgi:hypothetical protein